MMVDTGRPCAVAEELAGWEELAGLMAQQRDMLMRREHGGLTELNRLVAEKLGEQVIQHRERAELVDELDGRSVVAARLDELQQNVRNQAQVNCELAADALAHTEFLLEALYPQARSPVYDEGGKVGGRRVNAAVDWEA